MQFPMYKKVAEQIIEIKILIWLIVSKKLNRLTFCVCITVQHQDHFAVHYIRAIKTQKVIAGETFWTGNSNLSYSKK